VRLLPYTPVGEIRAENAIGFIHPDDRKYGVLAAGVQGTGKTSVLLRQFVNDLMDRRAAQIVMDPKMELVQRCLEVIPPDCGKEVWYLDLGDPVFGMTPLRMHGDSDFGTEAAAVAESVVAALLAIAPGQIFQSSRRYLYHAVIGALAIAHEHPQLRHGMFEHVHGLLLPKGPGEALRQVAAQACARLGLEQTAFFYTQELPGELQIAGHQAAARLDPPRNKIDGIVGVPPLKRFFQHPHDVSMRDLVERRAILLVNGNMARIGEDNAQVCMHFIFQMLHRQMQHQMHLPEAERPRVALIADEAGYLLSRNVVRQIATHRAAGLDVAIGIQYLGQLGAGAESGSVTEEIRKGVTNLLQSRFLFRLSDPRDADEVSRIAMALVSTMTQQDPDSRAYRRVGPEVMLNIENYFCLCSWIAGGGRIGSFIGQTFEMPHPARRWADEHLARLRAAVGTPPADFVRTTAQLTDPEQLMAALGGRAQHAASEPAQPTGAPATAPDEGGSPSTERGDGSGAVPVERLFTEVPAGRDPHFDSPALRAFGRPYARGELPDTAEGRIAPASLRELALVDRMTSITRWQEKPPARQPRLVDVDYAILRLLDRAGILLVPLLARACMPGKAERTVRQKLAKLHDAGLIARGEIDVHDRSPGTGALPSAVRLTAHGFRIGQQREVIDPDKQWRASEVGERALSVPHDQHVIAWITALTRLLGDRVVTDNWRTPRTRHGAIAPPRIGDGRNRHVLTPAELRPPAAGYAFDGAFTPAGPNDRFPELKPDATVEIRIPGHFTFDLLLELTLTAKPSHNRAKFVAYDAFLLGWWREHRRYQHLRGRPVILFVFASEEALRANAEIADREINGRLGIIGIPQHEWYWPAREHTFFALEEDIHHGALRCFALPKLPRSVRDTLGQQDPPLREVRMLPASLRAEPAHVAPRADPSRAEGGTGAAASRITRPMPGVRLADHEPGPGMAWLEALTQIEQIGQAESVDTARLTARTTLDEHDRRLLAAVDRVGLAPTELLAYAAADDLTPRALAGRLTRLHREGLIVRHRPRAPGGVSPPPLYSITTDGIRAAQTQRPPAISPRRRWQPVDGDAPTELVRRLRALAWTLALRRRAADGVTDNWRTRRYESGRYPVPVGEDGRAITLDELPLPAELTLADVADEFVEVKPDVSLELRLPGSKVSLELLVEVVDEEDNTEATILAYDAFLAGWCLADPRLARQSDCPVVVLVCSNVQAALSCARRADELLRARLGSPAQSAKRWRYPARERVLVAVESAIHHGERAMLALPPLPFAGQFQIVELLGA
jgi:hypothetical protein